MNWYEKGKSDVMKSAKSWPSKLEDYKKVCSEHEVIVSTENYIKGIQFTGGPVCTNLPEFNSVKWEGVGRRDAYFGKGPEYVGNYQLLCSPYRVPVKRENYKTGFSQGLREFCTHDRGLQFGGDGGQYENTCGPNEEARFLKGYLKGTKVYHIKQLNSKILQAKQDAKLALRKKQSAKSDLREARSELNKLDWKYDSDIRSLKSEIENLKDDLDDAESGTYIGISTPSQIESEIDRKTSDLEDLKSDRDDEESELKQKIFDLQMEISEAQDEYFEKKREAVAWSEKVKEAELSLSKLN